MTIDIKDIIMFSLFSVIIILMTIDKEHFVEMTNAEASNLTTQITNDKNTMRIISSFINDNIVKTNDTFQIRNISVDNLYVNKNMVLNGPSKIKNKINFVTHNNNLILDTFPRYSVIIYHNEKIPNKWALCDGSIWWVHLTDITIYPVNKRPIDYSNYKSVQTPDLRGRFIYGSKESTFNRNGGMEKVTLTESQLPPHGHPSYMVHNFDTKTNPVQPNKIIDAKKWVNTPYNNFSEINVKKTDSQLYALDTSRYGTFAYSNPTYEGALPHNNMPPYVTSYYIMKL